MTTHSDSAGLPLIIAVATAACSLYCAVLIFILFAEQGFVSTIAAAASVLLSTCIFEAFLAKRVRPVRALYLNTSVWILFLVALTVDAATIHPGLAKDMDLTASGLSWHSIRLLTFVGMPGVGLSICLYLISRKFIRPCGTKA